jgi:hypothetical protein
MEYFACGKCGHTLEARVITPSKPFTKKDLMGVLNGGDPQQLMIPSPSERTLVLTCNNCSSPELLLEDFELIDLKWGIPMKVESIIVG